MTGYDDQLKTTYVLMTALSTLAHYPLSLSEAQSWEMAVMLLGTSNMFQNLTVRISVTNIIYHKTGVIGSKLEVPTSPLKLTEERIARPIQSRWSSQCHEKYICRPVGTDDWLVQLI